MSEGEAQAEQEIQEVPAASGQQPEGEGGGATQEEEQQPEGEGGGAAKEEEQQPEGEGGGAAKEEEQQPEGEGGGAAKEEEQQPEGEGGGAAKEAEQQQQQREEGGAAKEEEQQPEGEGGEAAKEEQGEEKPDEAGEVEPEPKEPPSAAEGEGQPEGEVQAEQGAGQPEQEEEEEEPKPKRLPRTRVRTARPDEGVDLAMESSGLGVEDPITVGQMFQDTKTRIPERPALRYKEDPEGDWITISYSEYYDFCIRAAKSFLKLGLEPYHAVAIIGFNSPEWLISNLGAMFAGGLAAGIYTSNNAEACHFVADNCKANIIVVEDQKQLDKILEIRDHLPNLKAIVQYKGKLSQEYPDTYDWEQFMKLGDDMDNSVVEEKIAAQKPEQCALLIYTSGTTGSPKGVMLSHDNLTWTARCLEVTFGHVNFGYERAVSYLPLSHIAAQTTDIYVPIKTGGVVYFAKPDALKGTLVDTLKEGQPTIFFGVPRVYEKMMERMQERGASLTGFKRRMSIWAKKKGLKGNQRRQRSVSESSATKTSLPRGWSIANKLVFKKVREALGFQQCRLLVVGAAPIRREVHEFFMSLDMPLMELYGMSESSGPHTLNLIDGGNWRVFSCGRVLNSVYIKIDQPDEEGNGEICYHGRHVFMGYLNNEEKTREAIDDEGWLHSGDIGRLDEDGFLYITGRIKELIITSGGENIPPVPIENRIKKEVPFLSNVMVIGDHRKYLTCLMTLKVDMNLDTGEPTDELTSQAKQMVRELGSRNTTVSGIIEEQDKAVFAAIQEGLDRANQQSTSRAQKVQKFSLLDADFSIPGGELGPTLKVRRPKVVKKYDATIDAMYE